MSNGSFRGFTYFAAAFLALASLGAAPALADPIIDFQIGGAAGGSISYAGGANPIVGSNIPIRLVAGYNTPLNNSSTLSVLNGTLNFSTGNLVSYSGGLMTFGGSGSINISGSIPGAGINSTQTLLSGAFVGATFTPNTGAISLFIGSGSDTKNPALVSYYFPQAPPGWNFTASILGSRPTLGINNAFSNVTAVSVDIANAAVPEVGSVLMLGTSLLATAFLIRRRTRFGF